MSQSAGLDLTARQKNLVRDSFKSLEEYSESFWMLFYGRFFALDPAVRRLFPQGMHEQSRKLMDMLRVVVDAQDRFESVRPVLAELGRKHITYGAQPNHYETLRSALLWALGQALGEEFGRETKAAWTTLLDAVATVMLEGAGLAVTSPDT